MKAPRDTAMGSRGTALRGKAEIPYKDSPRHEAFSTISSEAKQEGGKVVPLHPLGRQATLWRAFLKLALPTLVAASLAAAACGAQPSAVGSSATSGPASTTVPETTAISEPGSDAVFLNQSASVDGIPTTVDSGELAVDRKGCLRMGPQGDRRPNFVPVWPPGYSLDAGGERMRILDGEGRVVARVGDEIRVGGGPASSLETVVDVDEQQGREIRERCPGTYFIVGEVLSARRR